MSLRWQAANLLIKFVLLLGCVFACLFFVEILGIVITFPESRIQAFMEDVTFTSSETNPLLLHFFQDGDRSRGFAGEVIKDQ